ncbi:MAG: helix-turn-helix domain-containing protein [Terriglobia bacterium]
MKDVEKSPYLHVGEFRKRLRKEVKIDFKRATLYRWLSRGAIPHIRIGDMILIHEQAIESFKSDVEEMEKECKLKK